MALFEARGILLQAQDQVVTLVDCDLLPRKHSQSLLECTKLIAQQQIRYMFSDIKVDKIRLGH